MRPISLHQIVTPELSPAELISLAARLECRHVCLFTHSPIPNMRLPVVDEASLADVCDRMADCDVRAYGVTSFPVKPGLRVVDYERAFELSAGLGAQYASVRIEDPDEARATEAFGWLAELAARYGIVASIEFMGYRAPDALHQTVRILEATGRGALSIDPLHIVRSGASLDTMRGLGPERIGYVQICDGPEHAAEDEYPRESGLERLPPGEGAFPLAEILSLAPRGRTVSLEVPMEGQRIEGVGAEVRARRVVEATRRFLAHAEPD